MSNVVTNICIKFVVNSGVLASRLRFHHLLLHNLDLTQSNHAPAGALQPTMASSSSNVVGVHYRVGKKIGEGSFGVIFEGTNLLNNQQVAIKFVCLSFLEAAVQMHQNKQEK
jgi:serine/threonine protein kinase